MDTIPGKRPYFAVDADLKRLGASVVEKVANYEKYVKFSGLYDIWAAVHRHLHGLDDDGYSSHGIDSRGSEGELVQFNNNFLRELVTHYRTLAQGQRASLEPVATDEDYESEVQKVRAKAVLEYADNELDAELLRNLCIEYAAVYGVGYKRNCWDYNSGDMVMPPNPEGFIPEGGSNTGLSEDETALTQTILPSEETVMSVATKAGGLEESVESFGAEGFSGAYQGDVKQDVFMPSDVIIDPLRRDDRHDWYVLRRRCNRHDLAAEYPAAASKILQHSDPLYTKPENIDLRVEYLHPQLYAMQRGPEVEQVVVLELWHKRTKACPNGLFVACLSDGTVLHREDLKYRRVYVHRVTPGRILASPFYYSPAFDLVAPQDAYNMLQSIALTNQRAHGVGIILMPQGSNLQPEEISTGLAVCEYIGGLGEPKALNFTNTPPEVFANMDRIEGSMQKMSGVSGVIRGDPQANLKSGSALVFMQSQSVQYATNFQADIQRFYEKDSSSIIELYQDFMEDGRDFDMMGTQDAIDTVSVPKDGLNRIRRVRVEVVNPMMHTLAGRAQIVDGMLEKYGPEVIPPEAYMRMLLLGRYEPVTRRHEKQKALSQKMCQLLSQGFGVAPMDPMTGQSIEVPGQQYYRPLITDNHEFMIREAESVLYSPAARSNERVVQATLEVIGRHLKMWLELTLTNPAILEATGQRLLASALGLPGGAPGELPGGLEPKGGKSPGDASAKANEAAKGGIDNSPPAAGQQPKGPQMPRDPLTGKRPDEPNLVGQQL